MNHLLKLCAVLFVVSLTAWAASPPTIRGTLIREGTIYISPDISSAKLGVAGRGRELIILESTRDWTHVEALVSEPSKSDDTIGYEDDAPRTITGWVQDKGLVQASTPNGDRVIFGEAVDAEDQATRSHGRRGAAQDAMRLYYRVADYFATSPVAAEALYRSADIRWQIEKVDIMSRPSAKEQDAALRGHMDDTRMHEVMKKYPGTKWADKAAFHLIENKLCGDWQGQPKCPEKEAELYEKFVADHPQSSVSAEALYDAATRYAALIEIYKIDEQAKKSDDSKFKATELTKKLVAQFPESDWATRAIRLQFMIDQSIPSYGSDLE
jgi:outer membrane protein assembly factor BamD (BamD/ComL family)